MIANASHYLALLSAVQKKSTIKTTAINAGSSLVCADKTLAISKPIRDSFIIIAPNEYIKEQKLLINPTSSDTVARASYLRPAVLPISSYKNTMLHITSDGSMAGQMFENESIKVSSTHKSGSVVKLGDAPTHILEGRFVDQDNQPIKLQGGLLIDYKSAKRPCYSFFTDERGRFQLIGVPDGEYGVKLLHTQKEVPLIKVEGETFLDLGDMILNWGDD